MKRYRERREYCVNPHDILVGYTGELRSNNRLVPLRITKKYKNALKQEELLRNEQILEMSQLIIKYENLVSIINSLRHENEKNLNCSLLLELEKKKAILKKRLLYLKSKLDLLPETLNKSMQNIFNSGSKYVHSNETFSRLKTKKKPRFTSFPKTTAPKTHDVTSSWFGSVKSQILVRDKNLQLQTINIDLFSNGENLLKVLSTEVGEEVKSYNVIFGTKQVDKAKTLWDQGIYHGSTVDLNVRFHGGMDGKRKKKKKKKTKKNNNIAGNADQPEFWTKHQVVEWIDNFCKEHEIDEREVSKLRLQNGKGLNMLLKEEWKERSPNYGDVLFRMWHELIKKDSTRETDTKKEEKTNEVCLDEKSPTLVEPAEEKASIVSEEPHDICEEDDIGVTHEVNESTPPTGPFGKVDDLTDLADSVSLCDLGNGPSANPDFGSVISITGVCSKEPSWRFGTVATMLIRDDPPGAASVFSQLKVDIRGSNQNQDLNYRTVELLLKKMKPGVSVAIRGRVELLEDENASSYPENEMLKFKLVVDSDYHALVYVENKTGLFTRQLSQPWYAQQGVYPFIVDDKRLHEGDIIQKTDIEENPIRRVFCKSSVSDSEIKKIAIAFKNSFDGDIFVGVEESGKVTGMKFTEGELLKWREQISMTIGQILPGSNEEVSICASDEEARESIRKKCFVSVMKLDECTQKNVEKVSVIARIHVPKGTARVYFSKQTDVHAFVRVGAENKRFNDYVDLFSRLESLSSRRIMPIADEQSYVEEQYKEAIEHMKGLQKLRVLKSIKYESQEREFKMIFGDKPVEIIEKKYFSQYTCGFLNSLGGSIFFGVQEDEKSKQGHVVGIVVPLEKREEFVRNSITTFSKFYPPVKTSQFRITFHDVSVSAELILRYHKTRVSRSGKCVLLRGPPEEIGAKWTKFIKDKLPGQLCRVIPVKPECFCIVAEKLDFTSEQFMGIIELFEKINSKVKLDAMDENELKSVLKDVCIIEIQVKRSPYPIHMVKPIETFVFDEHETLHQLKQDKLMYRFALDSRSEFDVEKFLNHVENFDPSGNSYVLVASPFDLPSIERDLYGLVIPKWTLTIDLDQQPKQIGHLYQVFEDLNDLHQTERNRFVRTSQDHKLDLNPDHGICWLAARGYEEIAKTLSEESHGKWNMTHRGPLRSLLEAELTSCVKPNLLNIVVLWDEGQEVLVDSLRTILEDILSINGDRTAITFVCSTPKSQSDVSNKLVIPLQDNYWEIMEEERVHVAPPYVLAQFLSYKLPAPYRPEDDYQIPHKKVYRQIPQTLPETLPQRLRQNIHGHLKMMYMTKERKPDVASLDEERKQFYSGSEITNMGLRGEIGIKRSKMAALEKEFRYLLNDKKSHVSLIFVKADRGAGTTTMCLQFLFQYHKEYPCAQLIEIRDGLVNYIEDINKATNLPLLLLVDQEIANLQDFLDFKKEVERRNINVILLLIEAAEVFCKKKPTSPRRTNKMRMKSARDSSLYGTSPYRMVELRRELEDKEVEELTKELIVIDKGKEAKLTKLKERAKQQKTLRTFAHFSLTAFGDQFLGLKEYVEFRLELADEKQKAVLAFLSLTHVFTDSLFPASALAGFLETKKVILEIEFGNSYLRELLSPPTDENDSRRISFLEVADEILLQLAKASSSSEDKYWSFIRSVSVQMAKEVLSVNISTKKIDRLARKLFVTSEYESEKFSLLVRSMKENNPDTARDTLIDLVEAFQKHTPFRAHLLAHLAKYHMNVNDNFAVAKHLIEEAIKEQKDDVLLRHIHGDIIRLQVLFLKNKRNIDMNTIVSHATESSECFEIVRNKRPHMSHGYLSDAIVRITVMQAAIKKIGGKKDTSFVDYLIGMIDEIKERDDEISLNERYLLSLIPDAHQYLDEGVIEFEHKKKWKKHFLQCIGELTNLKILCDKLKEEESSFSRDSSWLHNICVETQVLHNALEIETKDLSPEEVESRIKNIEECGSSSKFSERTMRFWIRYSRQRKSVPCLEDVRKRVMEWVAKAKDKGGISPHAEFYNYVINVLAALKDPKDREKMDKAEQLIKRQQSKKYNKKDVVLPLEWLHPKRGRHINSIDSLLNHDDLVNDTAKYSEAGKRRPGREVIEGFLFEKQITKWEGTVVERKSDWHGTIMFKGRLEVRFVPQNVQPYMPSIGDTVRFCLSFDRHGLSAWSVVSPAGNSQHKYLSEVVSSDEDSSSEDSEGEEDADNVILVTPPLYSSEASREKLKTWDDYIGQRMQGVVISIKSDHGFGFLKHPDVSGDLFFHAAQLFEPVKSLEGTISKYMALEFKVEQLTEKIRAADIRVLESGDVSTSIQKYLDNVPDKQHSSSSSSQRRAKEPVVPVNTTDIQGREEGVIAKLFNGDTFGFIQPDSRAYGEASIFFHRKCLVNKGTPLQIGDPVQFRVSESKKGLEANDIFVQSQFSSRWEHFIGRGIQEGFVLDTSDNGGIINSNKITGGKRNLNFYFNDILNGNFAILPGTKVHFEVQKRGGKCVAVRINVIGAAEGMPIGIPITTSGGAFLATYQSIPPLQLYAGPLDPYGNRLEDVDRMDKLP